MRYLRPAVWTGLAVLIAAVAYLAWRAFQPLHAPAGITRGSLAEQIVTLESDLGLYDVTIPAVYPAEPGYEFAGPPVRARRIAGRIPRDAPAYWSALFAVIERQHDSARDRLVIAVQDVPEDVLERVQRATALNEVYAAGYPAAAEHYDALASDDPARLRELTLAANAYWRAGRYGAAIERLQRVLDDWPATWTLTPYDHVTAKFNLAACHLWLGNYAAAREIVDNVIETTRERGTVHARALSMRATIDRVEGRYDAATESWSLALDIFESVLGIRSFQYRFTTALADEMDGQYASAAHAFGLGLDNLEWEQGEFDPQSIAAHAAYALFQQNAGLWRDAESTLEASRRHTNEWAGPRHPLVALRGLDHARWLIALGRYDEARAELDAAIGLAHATFGPGHVDYHAAIFDQAELDIALGEFTEGLPRMSTALDAIAETVGRDHPVTISRTVQYARALRSAKNFSESSTMLAQAGETAAARFGPDHPLVIEADAERAMTLALSGDGPAATEAAATALRHAESKLPAGHLNRAVVLNAVALAALVNGQPAEAESRLSEALALFTPAASGAGHPLAGHLRANRALALAESGTFPEALAECAEAAAIFRAAFDEPHPLIAHADANRAIHLVQQRGADSGSASPGELHRFTPGFLPW